MHRINDSLLAFAVLAIAPLASSAAPITVPTGLNPGDQYRLAFVTSTGRDALSSNIADYNAFVAGVAASVPELAALGTSWKAIATTSDITEARTNSDTEPGGPVDAPVYLLDDTLVATDNADLWFDPSNPGIAVSEQGHPGSEAPWVWTGAAPFGPLGDLLFPLSTGYGFMDGPFLDIGWQVYVGPFDPISEFALYAISAPLTVVPEPGAIELGFLGATAMLGWGFYKRGHRRR